MIRRFFRHLIESLKSLKRNGWMTVAAVSSVTITLSLVAIFASVILNTAKLASDISNNVRIVVYMRKDIADNSKTIVKEGQTVKNNDYHKIYDALTSMDHVSKVTYSSKEEQYEKLTETMGSEWKVFEGDSNPLYDAYIVDTTEHKYVDSVAAEAKKLIADAHLLEELGCFAIVLEKIPATLAERVASELSIPIIGIGAGGNVDGQVLVLHDMLGLNEGFRPRFLRLYAEMGQAVRASVGQYITDVKTRDFPNSEEQY